MSYRGVPRFTTDNGNGREVHVVARVSLLSSSHTPFIEAVCGEMNPHGIIDFVGSTDPTCDICIAGFLADEYPRTKSRT